MIPHVGIDLGTTFSCVSCLDENGLPIVIRNSDGQDTTPSVIWFDGKLAYIGKKANDRKLQVNSPIYEFVKRDIGKKNAHRYVVNGYDYAACGMSSVILKKLRFDIFYHFKRKGWLSPNDTIHNLVIPAVITVPAYFGFKERHETKLAGIAAGFEVIAIINEPTAAALTYGFNLSDSRKILVFDLGGGTFDVTILQIGNGEAKAIASDGADQLGGKDWDAIIENYLFAEFERQTDREIPDDMGWELQKHALESKYQLSESQEISVFMNAEGRNAEITLYRAREHDDFSFYSNGQLEEDNKFYFEERSENLLTLCKTIIHSMLEKVKLTWNDIDDIVLAGGSSRMPMIPKMLENISGKSIRRSIQGYNFDTAVSQGAALYGRNKNRVIDVSSKSIGIEVKQAGKPIIEHLIKKNTPLPFSITDTFPAEENAVLLVYEGESTNPADCILRGRLELGNSYGKVIVGLSIDISGVIYATVEANGAKAELKIKSDDGDVDLNTLKEKIDLIDIRL